jgi:hypothetical protein
MARADYCGTGTPWTVNGTTIDIYDHLYPQIQKQEAPSWADRGRVGPGRRGVSAGHPPAGVEGPGPVPELPGEEAFEEEERLRQAAEPPRADGQHLPQGDLIARSGERLRGRGARPGPRGV